MYVAEDQDESVLAMDFLTDFQCVLDIGSEETISLSREPSERLRKYRTPELELQMSAGDGDAAPIRAYVDTGSVTILSLKRAKADKVQLVKTHGYIGC